VTLGVTLGVTFGRDVSAQGCRAIATAVMHGVVVRTGIGACVVQAVGTSGWMDDLCPLFPFLTCRRSSPLPLRPPPQYYHGNGCCAYTNAVNVDVNVNVNVSVNVNVNASPRGGEKGLRKKS
jgi:hypothetical protein